MKFTRTQWIMLGLGAVALWWFFFRPRTNGGSALGMNGAGAMNGGAPTGGEMLAEEGEDTGIAPVTVSPASVSNATAEMAGRRRRRLGNGTTYKMIKCGDGGDCDEGSNCTHPHFGTGFWECHSFAGEPESTCRCNVGGGVYIGKDGKVYRAARKRGVATAAYTGAELENVGSMVDMRLNQGSKAENFVTST